MNYLFLFLGLITSSSSYEVVKIPVGMAAKKITCEQAFNKHAKFVENKNYKDSNNESWGSYKYKGKVVFMSYCKDSFGKWVP